MSSPAPQAPKKNNNQALIILLALIIGALIPTAGYLGYILYHSPKEQPTTSSEENEIPNKVLYHSPKEQSPKPHTSFFKENSGEIASESGYWSGIIGVSLVLNLTTTFLDTALVLSASGWKNWGFVFTSASVILTALTILGWSTFDQLKSNSWEKKTDLQTTAMSTGMTHMLFILNMPPILLRFGFVFFGGDWSSWKFIFRGASAATIVTAAFAWFKTQQLYYKTALC